MRSLKTAIINLDTDAAAFPKVIDHRAGGLLQKDFARTDQQKDFEKMARRSMPHANAKLRIRPFVLGVMEFVQNPFAKGLQRGGQISNMLQCALLLCPAIMF